MTSKDYTDKTPFEEQLFNGQLVTGRRGFLVGKNNYVYMKNMRCSPGGIGIESRFGMRRFNNTAVASGGDLEKIWQHLYSFEQDIYQDVYVVSDERKLYKADSIPESGAGAGSLGSALYTFSSGNDVPAFCSVENHAIATSKKDLIAYSGATPYVTSFLYGTDIGDTDDATDEDGKTFFIASDEVRNPDTSVTVQITLDTQANGKALYFGFWQPIDALTFVLGTALNNNAAAATIEYWNGSAWTSVSLDTANDTTIVSNATLGQSGSMSWTSPAAYTEKPHRINGLTLFWYRLTVDAALDAVDFVKITVTKDWNKIEDVTDGLPMLPSGCLWFDSSDSQYFDVLDRVLVQSKGTYISFTDETADQDVGADDMLYVGFPYRVLAIHLEFVEGFTNDGNAATLTPAYWTGTAWQTYAADEFEDGTTANSKTFNQSGEIRIEDKGTAVKPTTLAAAGIKLPMYWYRIDPSAKLYNDANDEMRLWRIKGIPAPLGEAEINNCNWVMNFKQRLWRLGPRDAPNTGEFSAYRNPFALSGDDTSRTWPRVVFGDADEVVCGVPFFNEALVFKRDEIWMMEGDSPDTFGTLLLDNTIGCVAPHTAKLVRTWVTLSDGRKDFRHAVFFMASDGIWACDGLRTWKLTADIENYFNPKYAECIKAGYRSKSSAFFDPAENEYHVFLWSGSTPTLLEFVYNTEHQRWVGPFVRLTECECGASVLDSNYDRIQYGGGTDGRLYRLEYGSNDVYTNGTNGAIDSYAEMGDHWTGLLYRYAHRGIFLFGQAQTAGSITAQVKGDGATNATTIGTISMVRSGFATFIGRVNIGDMDSSGAEMENKFHSMRAKFATNTAGVRMELFGFLIKKKDVTEAA